MTQTPRPNLSATQPALIGLFALFLMVFGLGAWAVTAELSGAILVPAEVAIEGGHALVQHETGGTVTAVFVAEGQSVQRGETLVTLDTTQLEAERATLSQRLIEVRLRQARLIAERDGTPDFELPQGLSLAEASDDLTGQRRLFQANREALSLAEGQLDLRRDQLLQQRSSTNAQHIALAQERALLLAELQGQERLLRQGLAQASRVLSLRQNLAALDRQKVALQSDQHLLESSLAELALQRRELRSKTRRSAIAELRDLALLEAELRTQTGALDVRIESHWVRAPIDGIVHQLGTLDIGSVRRAAEPIAQIAPVNAPRQIAGRVSPAEVSSLWIGQPARVSIAQPAGQEPEELAAHISRISPDSISDRNTGAIYFEVVFALADPAKSRTQQPGTPAEVYVLTKSHTPFAYLIVPIKRYFSRSLRES